MSDEESKVPSHWYKSWEPEVTDSKSKANYSPNNLACLKSFFSGFVSGGDMEFKYRDYTVPLNDESNEEPTHFSVLPSDNCEYEDGPIEKSPEMIRYEEAAKKSAILKLYEENSPANIKYFDVKDADD